MGDFAMNCPFCQRQIHGLTGLQELQKFERHLRRCRKAAGNITLSDGRKTVVVPKDRTMLDALEIRAESGQ